MTGYVVDASVAVKWLVRERWSREARTVLRADVARIAPGLLFAEASSALWAKFRRGEIVRRDLDDAIQVLRLAPVAIPREMRQLAPAATALAADLGHPVYDCYYLALALEERFPVVTADTRFHDRVSRHPVLRDSIVHVRDM